MNKTLQELKTKIRHKEIELDYEENSRKTNYQSLKKINQELDDLYQALDYAESNLDLVNNKKSNEIK